MLSDLPPETMVSAPTSTHFATIIKSVTDEASRLPSLGKISLKSRKLFAIDLSLVALAIRTGYLVDTATPRDAVDAFSGLLIALRMVHPIFENVIHIYEPTSDQSFFVNISMLLEKDIAEGIFSTTTARSESWTQRIQANEGDTYCLFVCLHPDQQCEFLNTPPAGVISPLQSLVDDLANISPLTVSKTLPRTFSQDALVPMAAVLIDYPVAYVPTSSDQVSFLCNVPLDVYECMLTFDESLQLSNPHTLLKFSCPSRMAKEHPDVFGRSHLIERLLAKFQPRIRKLPPGTELIVRQSVEIVDRVAL